ncbi:MAG TPA: hypothetical protein DCZ01_11160 [Elusimicrobia bacterium]|nr:hypothetical protein [Elusimicrobiota bacterium]
MALIGAASDNVTDVGKRIDGMKFALMTAVFFFMSSPRLSALDWSVCYSTQAQVLDAIWANRKLSLARNLQVSLSIGNPYILYEFENLTANLLRSAQLCGDYGKIGDLAQLLSGATDYLQVTSKFNHATGSTATYREWHCDSPLCPNFAGAPHAEVPLVSSQFLYLAAAAVHAVAGLAPRQRTAAMQPMAQAYVPVLLQDHYNKWIYETRQFGYWSVCGGHIYDHYDYLAALLSGALPSKPSYCRAVTDTDLWIISGVVELLAANQADPALVPIPADQRRRLLAYVNLGTRLIQSRMTRTALKDFQGNAVQGADFFAGQWFDHPDFSYAGYTGAAFPGAITRKTSFIFTTSTPGYSGNFQVIDRGSLLASQDSSVSAPIDLLILNNLSSTTVTFSASSLPPGTTAAFNPLAWNTASCGKACSTVLTLSIGSSTPTGHRHVTVMGTAANGVQRATSLHLLVAKRLPPAPLFDFSLSAAKSRQTKVSAAYTVTAALTAGAGESARFFPALLPPGVDASLSPGRCAPPCSADLTLTVSSIAPAGESAVVVAADDTLPADGIGWDISHARRFVHALGTLYDNRAVTWETFPDDAAMTGVANQVLYKIFNGDFKYPLFSNFMDGSNGWYRVNYSQRIGFAHAPYDLSNSIATGGWGLWSRFNPDLGRLMHSQWDMFESTNPAVTAFWKQHYGLHYMNFQRTDPLVIDHTQSPTYLEMLPALVAADVYGATGSLAPVITSVLTSTGTIGTALSYQITATNSPTSFNAAGLPAGLSVDTVTGLISGTPTISGISNVTISAANAGGTDAKTLTLSVYSACDVNRDGATNAVDVQLLVNETLGAAACTSDLNRDGLCNVIDVQRDVNAGLGGPCILGP